MDGYKFVYRLATMLKVDNNAFIVPIYSQDYDRVVGVYPVLPQSARVIEYQGRPYLRYQLGGGNWAAIEFEDVGILNQYQYKNDFFGETNRALNPTMQLLNAQNQGIIEGIKQSATIRFLAKIAQPLRPEDVDKERQRFIKANLGTDNNGGVMLVDTKYADVKQGKGKKVNEGAANDDFKDTKVAVELTGNDFSATCTLSYAAATMSIDALEAFIVQDMADQVGNAMAADLMTTIKGAINAANKLTAASTTVFTFAELCSLFGSLKRCRRMVAYVNNATLYKQLVALVDAQGRPIFQQTAQEGAQGAIIGAVIHLEDEAGDGCIVVGDPSRVRYNMVQDVMVETDKDIKNHEYIYSGYARGEGALIDDQSFAMLSLKTG